MSSISHRLGYRSPLTARHKPVKQQSYEDFIRTLPCVVTGGQAEAAHLSTANAAYGHFGRGKSQRASSRWVLPLCPEKHRLGSDAQHSMNEIEFWRSHGINPYRLALVLYGIWSESGPDGRDDAIKAIELARTT